MKIDIGNLVWMIAPSDEARGYGDQEPREPWQGLVIGIGGLTYWIAHVDEEGNPDDDSNASCHVQARSIYATEEDARQGYRLAIRSQIEDLEDKIATLKDRLNGYE